MDLAALITGIATLFTSLAALLAILEMRRQRRAAHRPEIVLTPRTFILRRDGMPFSYEKFSDALSSEEEGALPVFAVDCVNLGTGGALAVVFSWDYEPERHVALLARDFKAGVFEAGCASDGSVTVWSRDGRICHSPELSEEVPFIAPHDPSKPPLRLEMPLVYWDLVCAHWEAMITANRRQRELFDDAFPLKLKVEYRDLEGFVYSKHYSIQPKLGYQIFREEIPAMLVRMSVSQL